MAWKVSDDPDKFEEALEWFRARTPMSARMYYALDAVARDKAFTVSHVAQMDMVQTVLDSIGKAIESGQDLRQFSADVGDKLKAAWRGSVGNPAYRTEVIFRTNTASAFSRGRQLQMDSTVVSAVRPWRMFDDTRDARESDICQAAGGTIVRFDDPWLATHTPPLHHQCRSNLRALRDEQARRQKGWGKAPPSTTAAEGFGVKPTMGNVLTNRLTPDYGKYDADLALKAKAKEKKLRPAPPKPATAPSPRTTPEFWVKEFTGKYPTEVADAMAYGRAAEERGRSMPLDAISEQFDPLQHTADLRAQSHLKKARGLVPKAKTVGELLDGLDDVIATSRNDLPRLADATAARETLRAVSALKEHQRTAGNALPGVTLENADNPSSRELASRQASADSALNWLRKTVGPKLNSEPQKLLHTNGRSSYGADVTEWAMTHSLIHEWGHKLEHDNSNVGRRAKRFLAARAKGESPRKLSDLTGEGYGADEVATPDGFISPYMGKQYSGPYSEITSMGLQLMFTNYGARLLANDPEYFWFILGQLA